MFDSELLERVQSLSEELQGLCADYPKFGAWVAYSLSDDAHTARTALMLAIGYLGALDDFDLIDLDTLKSVESELFDSMSNSEKIGVFPLV